MSVSTTSRVVQGALFGSSSAEPQTRYALNLKRDLQLYGFQDPSTLAPTQQRRLLPDEVPVFLDEIFLLPLPYEWRIRASKSADGSIVGNCKIQSEFSYAQFLEDLFQAFNEYGMSLEAMTQKGGKSAKVFTGKEGTAWDYDLFIKIKEPKDWNHIEQIVLGCLAKQAKIHYRDDTTRNIRTYYQHGKVIADRKIPKKAVPIAHWKREGICGLILRDAMNFRIKEVSHERRHYLCGFSAGGKKFDIHVAAKLEHEAFCSANCIQIPLHPLFLLLKKQEKDFPRDSEKLSRNAHRLAECLHVISTDGYSLAHAEASIAYNSFTIDPPLRAKTLRKGLLIYLRFLTKMKKCETENLLPFFLEGFMTQYYEKERLESKRSEKSRLIFKIADFERDLRGEVAHFQSNASKLTYLLNLEHVLMHAGAVIEKDKVKDVIYNLLLELLDPKRKIPIHVMIQKQLLDHLEAKNRLPSQMQDFIEICKIHVYLHAEDMRKAESQRTDRHVILQPSPLITGFPFLAASHFLTGAHKIGPEDVGLYQTLCALFPMHRIKSPKDYSKELECSLIDQKSLNCLQFLQFQSLFLEHGSLQKRQRHLIYLLTYQNETLSELDPKQLREFHDLTVQLLFPLIEMGNKSALIAYLCYLLSLSDKDPKLKSASTELLFTLSYINSLPGFKEILEVHLFLFLGQKRGEYSEPVPFAAMAYLLSNSEASVHYSLLLDAMPLQEASGIREAIAHCLMSYAPNDLARMKESPLQSVQRFMQFAVLLEFMPSDKAAKLLYFLLKNRSRSIPKLGSKEREELERLIYISFQKEPFSKDFKAKRQLLQLLEIHPTSVLFLEAIKSGLHSAFVAGIKQVEGGANQEKVLEALKVSDVAKTEEGRGALAKLRTSSSQADLRRTYRHSNSSSSVTSISEVSSDSDSARESSSPLLVATTTSPLIQPAPAEQAFTLSSSPILDAPSLSLTETSGSGSNTPPTRAFLDTPTAENVKSEALVRLDMLYGEFAIIAALNRRHPVQSKMFVEMISEFYDKIATFFPSYSAVKNPKEKQECFVKVHDLNKLVEQLIKDMKQDPYSQTGSIYVALVEARINIFLLTDLKDGSSALRNYFMMPKFFNSVCKIGKIDEELRRKIEDTWTAMIQGFLVFPDAIMGIKDAMRSYFVSSPSNFPLTAKMVVLLIDLIFKQFKDSKDPHYLKYLVQLLEMRLAVPLSEEIMQTHEKAILVSGLIALEKVSQMVKEDPSKKVAFKEPMESLSAILQTRKARPALQAFIPHITKALTNAMSVLYATALERADAFYENAHRLYNEGLKERGDSEEIPTQVLEKWKVAFTDIYQANQLHVGERKYLELLIALGKKTGENLKTLQTLMSASLKLPDDPFIKQAMQDLVYKTPISTSHGMITLDKLALEKKSEPLKHSISEMQTSKKNQILSDLAKIDLDNLGLIKFANDSHLETLDVLSLYCASLTEDVMLKIEEVYASITNQVTRVSDHIAALEDSKKAVPAVVQRHLANLMTIRLRILDIAAQKYPPGQFSIEKLSEAYEQNQELLQMNQTQTPEWGRILKMQLSNKERCEALTQLFGSCPTADTDPDLRQLRIEVLTYAFSSFGKEKQPFVFEAYMAHLHALVESESDPKGIYNLYTSALTTLEKVLFLEKAKILALREKILALIDLLKGAVHPGKYKLFCEKTNQTQLKRLRTLLNLAPAILKPNEASKIESKDSKSKAS